MQRPKGWMRALIGLCGIMLAAAIFLPMWQIELDAPQYPEGLELKIYANKLGGDVDIVNGLNHYIGMRPLHVEDFPEFAVLPYILGFFALFCIVTAIAGRRRMLTTLLVLYVLFAVLAMIDFWKWEYEYGHNLDPTAPIQVPGMSYQPPLIGFKQLLNFGAYSIPDTGGWLMAGAGALLALCTFLMYYKPKSKRGMAVLLGAVMLSFSACKSGPEPIKIGVDHCAFCKMSIADARFGAEVLNSKGKAWKFDDIHCLLAFLKEQGQQDFEQGGIYFTRFDGDHALLPAEAAMLLQSEALHSPMGSNMAAFGDGAGLEATMKQLGGKKVYWKEIYGK